MQKFTRLIILLLLILIGMYFFLPNKPYLSRSKIHGDGLFAGKSYQKGEIIFEDLFPYKERSQMLFNPIQKEKYWEKNCKI